MNRPFLRLRIDLSQEFGLLFTERRNCFLAKSHGCKHVLFGNLLSTSLNHGDIILGTCNGQLEIGILFFLIGRVNDELAGIDIATDANARSRAIERRTSHHESRRSTCYRDGVGLMLAINNQRSGNHVNFLLKTINETRADWTVDHTSRQDTLVGRLCFALQVATGNTTYRIHLFHEINSQREKVIILLLLGNHSSNQYGGVTAGDLHGTRSLLCKLAGGKGVVLSVEVERFSNNVHLFSFTSLAPYCAKPLCTRFSGARAAMASIADRRIYKKPASAGLMLRCCRECRAS